MTCEQCGEAEARILVTVVTPEEAVEYRLCEECARELKESWLSGKEEYFCIFEEEMEPKQDWELPISWEEARRLTCPRCGMTGEILVQDGRMGCPDCYRHLRPVVEAMIRRIHGLHEHVGKKPRKR